MTGLVRTWACDWACGRDEERKSRGTEPFPVEPDAISGQSVSKSEIVSMSCLVVCGKLPSMLELGPGTQNSNLLSFLSELTQNIAT